MAFNISCPSPYSLLYSALPCHSLFNPPILVFLLSIHKTMLYGFEFIGIGKDFLKRMLIAQALRPTINEWDLMKLECFYTPKDTIWAKQPLQNEEENNLFQESLLVTHLVEG